MAERAQHATDAWIRAVEARKIGVVEEAQKLAADVGDVVAGKGLQQPAFLPRYFALFRAGWGCFALRGGVWFRAGYARAARVRIQGEGAESVRKARNTVPDGPFEGEVKAGVVGGAEGLAEKEQNGGEAVGEGMRDAVRDLLHGANMAQAGVGAKGGNPKADIHQPHGFLL